MQQYNKIPKKLQILNQWVLWKYETREGKNTKIPYNVSNYLLASTTDPSTWGSFRSVVESVGSVFTGIGFVFTRDDPFCIIDFDKCIDDQGNIDPNVKKIIDFLDSYTERSISGRGIHVIVKAKRPDWAGNRKGNIEIYDHSRYAVMTGDVLPGYPLDIQDRQAEIDQLCQEIFGKPTEKPAEKQPAKINLDDEEIIDKAVQSKNSEKFLALWNGDWSGYPSQSEADLALASLIAFWTQDQGQIERIMRSSGLVRDKWDKHRTYLSDTIQKALSSTEVYDPKPKPKAKERKSDGAAVETKERKEVDVDVDTFFRSAKELQEKDFQEVNWIVPGILPEGLSLLCGKPKVGKSWLALGLAVALSSGGKALGTIDMFEYQGAVLYLALEDNERRLRQRLSKLCVGEFPEKLYYTTEIPKGFEGCLYIRKWLEKHKEQARLVVIDTLASFRKLNIQGINDYNKDSYDLEAIQKLAGDFGVSVVCVHHLRKAGAEDDFDTISGTLGLTGKADTNYILKRVRGEYEAELKGVGRDLEQDIDIILKFDPPTATWGIVGEAQEYLISKERQEIISLLKSVNKPMTPKQIAKELGKNENTIKVLLRKMVADQEISTVNYGNYQIKRNSL